MDLVEFNETESWAGEILDRVCAPVIPIQADDEERGLLRRLVNFMVGEIELDAYQSSHRAWETWKSWEMKMVMERSWNMKNGVKKKKKKKMSLNFVISCLI